MQTFREFSPTPFDSSRHILPDRQDWVVAPFQQCRDSEAIAESNFCSGLKQLGGEGKDVEVHRMNHWGFGWVEIVLVRPNSEAHKELKEIASALADYPVLDDEDFSKREYQGYLQAWEDWGAGQYISALQKKFKLDDDPYWDLECIDRDKLRVFFEEHNEEYMVEGGPNLRNAGHNVTREELDELLKEPEVAP